MTGLVTKGKALRGDLDLYDGVSLTNTRTDSTGGTLTGRRIGDAVDVLEVYGGGTAYTLATLNSALSAIGATTRALTFAPGTWAITDSVTIPATTTVIMAAGATFSVTTGKTLTIAGPVFPHESGTGWYGGAGTTTITGYIAEHFLASGTGAVLRTAQSKASDVVHAFDFNAKFDGDTDDYEALQAAIDALPANGGTVVLPPGEAMLSATLTLDAQTTLLGAGGLSGHVGGTGPTQLTATHSSGPVIKIADHSCRVADITVSADSTRNTGAAGSNYGIHAEGADTSTGNAKSTMLERIRVTKQPNHAYLFVSDCVQSHLHKCDADNILNGHAFVVDGGDITSRTNKVSPGQMIFENCRASRIDGHSLVLGSTGTANTDIAYRCYVENFEAFYCNVDPTKDIVAYSAYVYGQNHTIVNSAFSGLRESDDTDVFGGVHMEGQHIQVLNTRFIECNPYVVNIGYRASPTGGQTNDCAVLDCYCLNTKQPSADFYNPAVNIDTNSKNIHVRLHDTTSDVASASNYNSISPVVEDDGSLHVGKELSARSFISTVTPISLADDAAAYLTFSAAGTFGIAVITGNVDAGGQAVVSFRVGDGSAFVNVLSSGGVTVTGQTGTLTGMTGVDGQVTISADTATNTLYIENRTAGTKGYDMTFLGLSGGVYSNTITAV